MNDPQPEGHMASYIERRELLAALGGTAAAWPFATRAQQGPMPVIGYLTSGAGLNANNVGAFRKGLSGCWVAAACEDDRDRRSRRLGYNFALTQSFVSDVQAAA